MNRQTVMQTNQGAAQVGSGDAMQVKRPWLLVFLMVCALGLSGCSLFKKPSGGGYYQNDGPGSQTQLKPSQLRDAVPRVDPLMSGPNKPYTVNGKRYTPDTREVPYKRRGNASWYGKQFHGRPTSSGERYDMYAMSAAHTTLPIPCYVRVTHTGNGRSVIVRVNDRGPFHSNRIIDLSYAAAYKLGFINQGTAEVIVERIMPADIRAGRVASDADASSAASREPPPPTTANPPGIEIEPQPVLSGGYFVQIGAYTSSANAQALSVTLSQRDADLGSRLRVVDAEGHYKVYAGPYASQQQAQDVASQIDGYIGVQPLVLERP